MKQLIKPAPIRKTLTVRATPEKAFAVFTDGFDRWWPRPMHVGKTPLARAAIEPGVGGRWYGVGEDGVEDRWGDVLVWEPPRRLVLAWRINAEFVCDPAVHSEVDVTFTPLEGGVTRVDLEHRQIENLGKGAETVRQRMDAGWGGILAGFAAVAGE
jgi:uncharacterized protein YndB with AHSA1/START domain